MAGLLAAALVLAGTGTVCMAEEAKEDLKFVSPSV